MPKIIENLAQRLAEEARRQVLEQGYDAMNIRSVAKNCGVGTGTVYNYYPSKDALIAGFLLEDWMNCLARIRTEGASGDAMAVLNAIYRELTAFLNQYQQLFQSASAAVPAPPRKYHAMLRSQIADLLIPFCRDAFTADFIAEAMVTWTVEGKPCAALLEVIQKLL